MTELKFYELKCQRCGGELAAVSGDLYVCRNCGKKFEKHIVSDVADQLRAVLNEQKQETVANLRRQLWAEMHETYINSAKITTLAREIKKYLPEDYFANFCDVANSGTDRQVSEFLMRTPPSAMADYADAVLDFMLKSVNAANLNAISLFIERAFKGDTVNYDKYVTAYETEAEKVNSGIYELILTRDVFLAYSSADIDKVLELCDFLESNGITCFLALRNLRHGRGAVDNYDKALRTAIDNCRMVVFVSGTNSRSLSCDALTKELPYIRQKDIDRAPAEFKYDYSKLPAEYMMPRVEYLIEDYTGSVAEGLAKEFFHGLEWCKSKEEVAARISRYLTKIPKASVKPTPAAKAESNVKYCKKCHAANKINAKFCSSCGGREFFASYEEYLASKIKFCAVCGTQNNEEDKFCTECGSKEFVSTKREYEAILARKAEEERQRKLREEQERKRKEEEERKRLEEEQKRKEEQKHFEEQERKRKEEQARQRREKEERKKEAARKRKVEEEQEQVRLLKKEQDRFLQKEKSKKYLHYSIIIISLIIIIGIVLGIVFGTRACNSNYTTDGLTFEAEYNSSDNISNYKVVSYSGSGTLVEIPSTYNGYSVTSIDNEAFSGCTEITKVTIPDSITYIGEFAFLNCISLESVTIGDKVASIDRGAFYGCVSLTNIIIPDSVKTIGYNIFACCRSLESVTIGSGLTSINSYAFYNCTSLSSITISDSVTAIEYCSFAGCTSLLSINIPNSVVSITKNTFNNCTALESVTFENTSGWTANYQSLDLSDSTINATYLTSTYSTYDWYRSDS